jgi:hypothetical protein
MKALVRSRTESGRSALHGMHRWLAALAGLASPLVMAQVEEPATGLPNVDLVMLQAEASPPTGGLNWAAQARGQAAPEQSLKLGLRWRPAPIAGRQFAAQVWHRLSPAPDPVELWHDGPPLYGAQVEMQLSSAKRVSLRDLLGLKLDNNSRVSVRPRKGKVSIYYKVQF